jgi:hypothetical protein
MDGAHDVDILVCLQRPNSWTKSRQMSWRVFLLAIHSHLYSFPLRFFFFKVTQPLTAFTVQLLYTVKEKGGKPYPLPYGLRNPYRNLRTLKIMPWNVNEIVRSWIQLQCSLCVFFIAMLAFIFMSKNNSIWVMLKSTKISAGEGEWRG